MLPKRIDTWSLSSVQQRLVKTGGRLVRHARYYWLLIAESHLTKRLFGSMLRRIWALPVPDGADRRGLSQAVRAKRRHNMGDVLQKRRESRGVRC